MTVIFEGCLFMASRFINILVTDGDNLFSSLRKRYLAKQKHGTDKK